ncbi:DUF2190 family protein [Vibrio sp. 10N.261.55.A7]|uniref:DUF2190 family protein n=1 Tax=Vibrio sp. 10N.261.55.A7 TaxID=1880851 RepID=UPI000C82C7DC|nr:DUF2190 family protein [Vibrio sp. 10N.261.55.A7]PMJ90289.1 hypothetical protein BCU12_12405 [Vibrio sp. 10N.261.55.A7]
MQLSKGKKIAVIAPVGGFTKDVPVLVGALLVVPHFTVQAGDAVTCSYDGFYDGPIKAGDTPAFNCEPAYFKGGEFTKTLPSSSGDIKQPIGVFVEGGVLLMGEVITQFVA